MQRLNKEHADAKGNDTSIAANSKAPAFNTPDMKALTGKMPFSR